MQTSSYLVNDSMITLLVLSLPNYSHYIYSFPVFLEYHAHGSYECRFRLVCLGCTCWKIWGDATSLQKTRTWSNMFLFLVHCVWRQNTTKTCTSQPCNTAVPTMGLKIKLRSDEMVKKKLEKMRICFWTCVWLLKIIAFYCDKLENYTFIHKN